MKRKKNECGRHLFIEKFNRRIKRKNSLTRIRNKDEMSS